MEIYGNFPEHEKSECHDMEKLWEVHGLFMGISWKFLEKQLMRPANVRC